MSEKPSIDEVRKHARALIDKGVSPDVVMEFIQSAGYTADQLRSAQPWYKRFPQIASDVARVASEGLTFGGTDLLRSAVKGTDVRSERTATEAAKERLGIAAPFVSTAGSLPTIGLGGAGAAKVLGEATKSLPFAVAEGGLYGALDSVLHGENAPAGAAIGALTGGASKLALNAAQGIGRLFRKSPSLYTSDELGALKRAAYDNAESQGIGISPQGIQSLVRSLASDPDFRRISPDIHAKSAALFSELSKQRGLTLGALEDFRKQAGDIVRGKDASEAWAAKIIRDKISQFQQTLKANSPFVYVPPGSDARSAIESLESGRNYAQQQFKTDEILDRVERAKLRSEASQSGSEGARIRSELASELASKSGRDWRGAEKEAIESAVKGFPMQNWAQRVEKLSPTESRFSLMGMLGSTGGVGAFTQDPTLTAMAAAPWALGAAAEPLSSRYASQSVNDILAAIQRTPQSAPTWLEKLATSPLTQDTALALGLQLGPERGGVKVRPWSEVEGQQK